MPDQEMTVLGEEVISEDAASVGQDKDYLTELVGEGKKYKDATELAKAYANADQFIETLKSEKHTLEEEYNGFKLKAKTVEDVLSRLDMKPEPKPVTANEPVAIPVALDDAALLNWKLCFLSIRRHKNKRERKNKLLLMLGMDWPSCMVTKRKPRKRFDYIGKTLIKTSN